MQLILEPGFSTAGAITQQAGRGVGMDVVATEIKRLGGALHMETKAGEGTVFTIRLPFTLAISHALVVRTGEEFYALPLPTVEGVLRLSKAEVTAHLGRDAAAFDYGGQKYRFQHLATFVSLEPSPLPEQDVTIPVVLVRAGEHSTGLVADELVGSREIVVKSVGPQISSIRGISGATILGDGRIVIILDIGALVRAEWRGRPQTADRSKEKADKRRFAMVVDDSITVRRVTQRLLERNGMRVLTARDGMDAVALLQDNIPDIILLDIEMPRMDGYEVAAHVRNDPRLKDVPIIMITSRVGEKHRARAIELGVDDYLGKPYQEAQLLEAIAPLVERRRVAIGSHLYAAEVERTETNAMAERVTEIYSLLVPLIDGRLIIPRACVAEVVGFQTPSEMTGAPPWYIGTVPWNGKAVPLVSFEGACGQMIPPASGRTRIVILHALGTRVEGGNFALVSQGFPQLVRVSNDVVRPDNSRVFPDRAPVICQVRMINETPLVPDLERLEEMIAEETTIAS